MDGLVSRTKVYNLKNIKQSGASSRWVNYEGIYFPLIKKRSEYIFLEHWTKNFVDEIKRNIWKNGISKKKYYKIWQLRWFQIYLHAHKRCLCWYVIHIKGKVSISSYITHKYLTILLKKICSVQHKRCKWNKTNINGLTKTKKSLSILLKKYIAYQR